MGKFNSVKECLDDALATHRSELVAFMNGMYPLIKKEADEAFESKLNA